MLRTIFKDKNIKMLWLRNIVTYFKEREKKIRLIKLQEILVFYFLHLSTQHEL